MRNLTFVLVVIGVFAPFSRLRANLVFEDSFDYTPGNLDGVGNWSDKGSGGTWNVVSPGRRIDEIHEPEARS